jgi:hypothetical protein
MPVHDWARVEAGIFHDFHVGWLPEIRTVLNGGLLPEGYYALTEQHAGKSIADVLTLHTSDAPREPLTRRKHSVEPAARSRRRSLAIRHVSGHRLIALLEIVSPANKDRAGHVSEFTGKLLSALNVGVHVLLVDLFRPGRHDPQGLHGEMLRELEDSDEPYDLPREEPLTLASYVTDPPGVDIYLEHVAVGATLPEMPLFLSPNRYVNVPLESTYLAAYRGLPAFWREVLERSSAPAE